MVLERWRPSLDIVPWRYFRMPSDGERGWTPALDVFEKRGNFIIKAELPGIREEDIDLSIAGDTLTIKGEKKSENEIDEDDYYHVERLYGSFMRSISLPSNIDTDKIEAKYEDGVLEISLPKTAGIKPKKVKIEGNKTAGK